MSNVEKMLEGFKTTHQVQGKGSLALVLVITREAKHEGLPLNADSLKTPKHGQVKGLSKGAVQKILREYGIDQVLAAEGGRTSRGSLALMENYVRFLNDLHRAGKVELDIIEAWWVRQVKVFLLGKPFKLHADPSKSVASAVRDLLDQAESRQKDGQGTMFAGALMQHLVGAKLTLALPENPPKCSGFSVADEANTRAGDFVIEDVIIHVTATPTETLLKKCRDNIDSNLRPIVVTTSAGVVSGHNLAKLVGIGSRVDFFEIEQFIALNVYELSRFSRAKRETAVIDLISTYNRIVKQCETDYGMLEINPD